MKNTLRWSKYVLYENGKSAEDNGIRRQNVEEHTLSKLLAFGMIMPLLLDKFEKVFGRKIEYNLLWVCIVNHDFGEGLRKQKFDVLANDKKDSHDLEEYLLLMEFLDKSGLKDPVIKNFFQKAFLLQFALTSHEVFPEDAKKIMKGIRENEVERNTAILFQILEKWEYFFYALEHKEKHPTISDDVASFNSPKISHWISMYPEEYHQPLKEIFVD